MIKSNNKRIVWGLGILIILILIGFQILAFKDRQIKFHEEKLNEMRVKASRYMDDGMYDEAIGELTKLIKNNRNFYRDRGLCYFAKGLHRKSLEDLNRAIEINDRDVSAYSIRGLVYEAQEEFDMAIIDFNKVANSSFEIGVITLMNSKQFASFNVLEDTLKPALYEGGLTDLQKKELRRKQKDLWEKEFRGKKVYWGVKIEDVFDELFWIRVPVVAENVKINIFFNLDQEKEVLRLEKGQRVKVLGVLDDFDGLTAKYSIRDAKIIIGALTKEDIWGRRRNQFENLIEEKMTELQTESQGELCDSNGDCWRIIDGDVVEKNNDKEKNKKE